MQAPFKKKSLLSTNPAEPAPAMGAATGPALDQETAISSAMASHATDLHLPGLPPELAKALGPEVMARLAEGVKDLLDELHKQPQEPDEPFDESKLNDFLEQAVSDLPIMLHLFEHTLSARAWTSRVLIYEPAPAPAHWRFEGAYAAEPHLLSGGLSGLDDLMDGLRENAESGSAALWLHGVALDGKNLFMAYLRWAGGPPVLLMLHEGQWGRVETTRHRQLMLLQLVLGSNPSDSKRWKAFMAAQADWLHDHLRDDFDSLLTGWGLEPLSDARWEDLVRVAYVNKSMVRLYQECARSMSEDPLMEAHGLLKAQANHFETQVKFFNKRKQELEKELEKKTKRLRSDLERSEMLAKGAQSRAHRLQEENAQLIRQSRPGVAPQAPSPPDFVAAVDRLFAA